MKKLVKIGVVIGAVAAVGALAYYGLKKLVEKADECGCCDGKCKCEGDGYMGTCECDCHCHENAEPTSEVKEPTPTAEEPAVEDDFVKDDDTTPAAE